MCVLDTHTRQGNRRTRAVHSGTEDTDLSILWQPTKIGETCRRLGLPAPFTLNLWAAIGFESPRCRLDGVDRALWVLAIQHCDNVACGGKACFGACFAGLTRQMG